MQLGALVAEGMQRVEGMGTGCSEDTPARREAESWGTRGLARWGGGTTPPRISHFSGLCRLADVCPEILPSLFPANQLLTRSM